MKKPILILVIILIFWACTKKEDESKLITDGDYQGYFTFRGDDYWSKFTFESATYDESVSSIAPLQKELSCITRGTYMVRNDKLIVELNSFKYPANDEFCLPCKILPGVYTMIYTNQSDSIVFERGQGETHIIYYLKKIN